MKRTALVAWILLAIGLLFTVYLANTIRQGIDTAEGERFAHAADQIALVIRERLESYELGLRGGSGLLAAADHVDRRTWKVFVDTLQADENLPGVQGIGFAQLISPAQLDAHVAAIRAEGFPDYTVTPPGPRGHYTAIIYLEPFRDRNLRAFGYDMYAEPVRRDAMDRARDTGTAALSGKVELVQETALAVQAGTLMYVPVYRKGMPVNSVEQRRAALAGWVYSPFRMNDLMTGILSNWRGQLGKSLNLMLYDSTGMNPATLLYSTTNKPGIHADHALHQHRSIDFNGHRWLLVLDRDPALTAIRHASAWRTLAGGFAISVLLFWLLQSLFRTQQRAERIAARLTLDIRQKEQQLKENEYRWKFALDGSNLGVWDWNLAEGTVFFSSHWKSILGYAEQDIGNSRDEWVALIHPDDLEATMAAVQAYLDGKTPDYANEHRVRSKDGHYKWILDRGTVVSRSDDSRPLRMIGTHADISERKQAEETLLASRELLHTIIETAPIRVFWKDTALRYLGCNSVFAADAGRSSPEELVGKDDFQMAWREQAARYRADDQMILESGRPKLFYEEPQTTHDGRTIWLRTSKVPLRDKHEKIIGLLGIYEDITQSKQSELRVRRLTSLYAALSETNAAILLCNTREALFERLCKVVVDLGGMTMAWVGLTDPVTGRIVPVESYGKGTDYLEGIVVSVNPDDSHGRGPTGTAARERRAIWLDDFANAADTLPWRQRAMQFGWTSSAALPIMQNNKPIGALTFYTTEPGGWVDQETRDLLEKMAASIGVGLDRYAADAVADTYRATLLESEQRFRTVVEQAIAGAFIIQDGRFIYVNPRLAQILSHPDRDSLIGRSPLDIVAAKDHEAIGQKLRSFLDSPTRSTEFAFTGLRSDGASVDVGISTAKATYQQRPAIIGLMQDISDKKVAEERIRRYAGQLEQAFMQMVSLATTLSEMRDAYTAGHEKRVAEIAVAIGRELGFPEDRVEGLRVGGYLHDVGKVSIPTEILSKPGRLSSAEMALIRTHAQAGFDVLKNIEFPWPVAQIALQHHERIDGSGYPNGLKGEEIILEARITAVADVVESMATHRPYRPAQGLDKALAEIERGAGSIYDPLVAAACLRLFREKGYQLPPQS